MKVLITGATGLVGKQVGKALVKKNHQVFVVSRDAKKAKLRLPFPCEVIEGDLSRQAIHDPRLAEIDAVIHLMGENVGESRWSEERKKRILASRVDGTRRLYESLRDNTRLRVVVAASAVGFYGDCGDQELNEASVREQDHQEAGSVFLEKVCQSWETAIVSGLKENFPRARDVVFRCGVILSSWEGALPKMMAPFQKGLGTALGSGQQWMSWIHIDDMVDLYVRALEDASFQGIYNATAPRPVSNAEFASRLAETLHQRLGPAVPALALKLALGEMSCLMLASQQVLPQRLLAQGFSFQYAELGLALEDLCALLREGDLAFRAEQFVPVAAGEAFSLFAEAKNWERISPSFLDFHIEKVSPPHEVAAGSQLEFQLKSRGLPLKWKMKIEEWEPGRKFVENQVAGPFKRWRQTHTFEELGAGTLLTDVVCYQLPLGVLGNVVGGFFVPSDIEKIFDGRRENIARLLKAF
jgi:uncharacterized protein (TIGR01777 family)